MTVYKMYDESASSLELFIICYLVFLYFQDDNKKQLRHLLSLFCTKLRKGIQIWKFL